MVLLFPFSHLHLIATKKKKKSVPTVRSNVSSHYGKLSLLFPPYYIGVTQLAFRWAGLLPPMSCAARGSLYVLRGCHQTPTALLNASVCCCRGSPGDCFLQAASTGDCTPDCVLTAVPAHQKRTLPLPIEGKLSFQRKLQNTENERKELKSQHLRFSLSLMVRQLPGGFYCNRLRTCL